MRRAAEGALYLYPADDSHGWKEIRIVPFREGLMMVAAGKWALRFDEHRQPWYFQLKQGAKEGVGSEPSPTTITANESGLNACSSDARDKNKPTRPFYDAVDRVVEKVKQWPYPASRIDDGSGEAVYGDRATRVYPTPA